MSHASPVRTTGFTLIELLVTISIMAILMAILLPTIKMVREAAKSMKCQNSLRQIGLAALNYSNAWEGQMPDCKGNGADWETRLAVYVEANYGQSTDQGWGQFTGNRRVFAGCPNAKAAGGPNFGYAMSYVLLRPNASTGYSYNDTYTVAVKSFISSQITYPSQRFYIGERSGDQNVSDYGVLDFSRHRNNKSNALMCDYHVESLSSAEANLAINNPSKLQ